MTQSGNEQNSVKHTHEKGTKHGMRWKNIRFCASSAERERESSEWAVCLRACLHVCVILFVWEFKRRHVGSVCMRVRVSACTCRPHVYEGVVDEDQLVEVELVGEALAFRFVQDPFVVVIPAGRHRHGPQSQTRRLGDALVVPVRVYRTDR